MKSYLIKVECTYRTYTVEVDIPGPLERQDVLCKVIEADRIEGETDGTSWTAYYAGKPIRYAKNHMRWLGHDPKEE